MHLPGQGELVSHLPQQGTWKNAWLPAEAHVWGIYTSEGVYNFHWEFKYFLKYWFRRIFSYKDVISFTLCHCVPCTNLHIHPLTQTKEIPTLCSHEGEISLWKPDRPKKVDHPVIFLLLCKQEKCLLFHTLCFILCHLHVHMNKKEKVTQQANYQPYRHNCFWKYCTWRHFHVSCMCSGIIITWCLHQFNTICCVGIMLGYKWKYSIIAEIQECVRVCFLIKCC